MTTSGPRSSTQATAAPTAAANGSSDGVQPPAPVVRTIPEAANAAARLLEIAGQNAEQLVTEAHDSADKILSEATIRAERLAAEAKAKAEALETEAQTRSEQLDEETSQRKVQVLAELERDRDNLAGELEHLRVFEREYRSRLRGLLREPAARPRRGRRPGVAVSGGAGRLGAEPAWPARRGRRRRELLRSGFAGRQGRAFD